MREPPQAHAQFGRDLACFSQALRGASRGGYVEFAPFFFFYAQAEYETPECRMSFIRCLNFMELFHQLPGGSLRVRAAGFTDPVELNHVQPTLTQFQATNQIALTFQPSGQLPLIQSGFAAQFNNGFANTLALPGVDSFVHAPIMRANGHCTQNASMVLFECWWASVAKHLLPAARMNRK